MTIRINSVTGQTQLIAVTADADGAGPVAIVLEIRPTAVIGLDINGIATLRKALDEAEAAYKQRRPLATEETYVGDGGFIRGFHKIETPPPFESYSRVIPCNEIVKTTSTEPQAFDESLSESPQQHVFIRPGLTVRHTPAKPR